MRGNRTARHILVTVARRCERMLGSDLTVELLAPSPRVTTDIDRARQILIDLAGNAMKFTEKGGVRISVAASNEVRIAVIDSGIGIPVAQQRNLFKPFAKVGTGLTRRHGGTGLGLYISSQLAKLLGGRIELSSQPDGGSTFTLVLPSQPLTAG